ncbi:MAG: hypothetical protein KBG28_10550 [Kofleriaceae bacterium]|jgi:hypothetical protein|nr:hypothetical protein [Kofleriaceae bacterium]MBP6837153.1 hypothetical protein [Kofleriaceae bacterium]MBP9204395.1 hypothetical protein [Kofleriaceae bacterium]
MRTTTILLSVLTATTVACGGGGDDRLVSSLSDADFVALCQDQFEEASEEEKRGVAGLGCLIVEAFMAPCDQARLDACITSTLAMDPACEAPDAMDPIRMCDATVDEVDACNHSQLALFAELADATCADLGSMGGTDPTMTPDCLALEAKCPGLFDDQQQ